MLFRSLDDFKSYTATYTAIAKKHNVSVSTVVNVFDNHVQIQRHKLKEIICIDEFYFNRHSHHKYALMIMGFKNKLIVDIIESRRQQILSDYLFKIPLDERMVVKYVCIDMYRVYRDLIKVYFPKAKICVDSFHVIKRITDGLNTLRKRICRRYKNDPDSREYKLLKYRYKTLLKNSGKINNTHYFFDRILGYTCTEAGLLEAILSIDPQLRLAYQLKELYQQFNSIREEDYIQEEWNTKLNAIINAFYISNIKEMKEIARTLSNWSEEILNSFTWCDGRRISNGCIEGKNSYLKKMISNANGFTNFQRARNRMMYSQNLHEKYSISVKNIKSKKTDIHMNISHIQTIIILKILLASIVCRAQRAISDVLIHRFKQHCH